MHQHDTFEAARGGGVMGQADDGDEKETPEVDKGKGNAVEPQDSVTSDSPLSLPLSSETVIIKTSSLPSPPAPPEPAHHPGGSSTVPPLVQVVTDLLVHVSSDLEM